MTDWNMLTLVGEDRPGIVARVTDALYHSGWNLGEASMMRLGENFTIMMMVSGAGEPATMEEVLRPVAEGLETFSERDKSVQVQLLYDPPETVLKEDIDNLPYTADVPVGL